MLPGDAKFDFDLIGTIFVNGGLLAGIKVLITQY